MKEILFILIATLAISCGVYAYTVIKGDDTEDDQ